MNSKKTAAMALTVLIFMGSLCIGSVWAKGGGPGGHQGLPAEAFTACEGKSEGDTASFETADGQTVTGICKKDKRGERLLLIPDNAPERGRTDDGN